ncbi:hypothetical protein [Mycobacteroides abscessus]|uniref:hypothetical protein n=1 Tax=Mycobacteroides abscessus TaxID=36809 RepID=UPI001ED94E92|nr:hypothetical protein [Mycobacteroides abscessus]
MHSEVFGNRFDRPPRAAQLNQFGALGSGEQPVWSVEYVVGTLTGLFGVIGCNEFR